MTTEDDPHISNLNPDELLARFLDACRDRDQDAGIEAIHELRYRVWGGSPLPHDVRPDPAQQAEIRRMSALIRELRRQWTGAL
jgi:hypothetical protein